MYVRIYEYIYIYIYIYISVHMSMYDANIRRLPNASVQVSDLKLVRGMAHMSGRFEYSYISWSTMEGNDEERWWDMWSRNKAWTALPPMQQERHRRCGEALYIGDGMANVKFCFVHHPNLDLKPTWKMYLGKHVFCFPWKVTVWMKER